MKNKIFFVVALVVLAVVYTAANWQKDGVSQLVSDTPETSSQFVFEEEEFDFGVIKQSDGKVSHEFTFTYNGSEPIKIIGVPTSCACTSAITNKTELNPGDSAVLTVKFNPNLHEEPTGRFFKTVIILTEPKIEERPEVRIWVEIDLDLGPEAYELKLDHDEDEEDAEDGLTSYNSITSEKFSEMLADKDFTLIDVHIPEQEHIEGTDLLIPYDEIEDRINQLPAEKNAKIVLYCRSGGMSRAAAYTLAESGYTNVYDLVGGKNEYDKFLEAQSSKD